MKIGKSLKKATRGLKKLHKAGTKALKGGLKTLKKGLGSILKLPQKIFDKVGKLLGGLPQMMKGFASQIAQTLSHPFAALSPGGIQMMSLMAGSVGPAPFVSAMNNASGGIPSLPPAAQQNILQIAAYYHARQLC
jgi:hypothetical protein